ncbi:MAG: 2-aminoethylphosphonate--pyruvate transaminase [Opitutaceae bacterium]|nr:2-aminoethylphosphonate--pyruvate transaminase [Opitutaceae bacterium]
MELPPRKILLNPGPGTTTDAVKEALLVADICPREAEFAAVVAGVRRDLLAVAGADASTHAAVLLAGPGTAAVEAALGSLVPAMGRVLIVANGAYGERAAAIAAALGIPARVWSRPWTSRPTVAEFTAQLTDGERCTHAFWVHHETTTGLLNPLEEFGAACRTHGVTSIVDAMSSFGGLPLSLGSAPVDVLISSANKCLQGLPGISFVLARRAALAASAGVVRSVALDLHAHERSLADGQFPFTPPVPVVYALAAALRETLAETVPARAARYRACHEVMLAGMEAMGFAPLLPRELQSGLLTTFLAPRWPGFTFADLHDYLYARGITLYPGKLHDADTFRVANLGALTPDDLRTFHAAVKDYLNGLR